MGVIMKELPCECTKAPTPLKEALPDGIYAVIRYEENLDLKGIGHRLPSHLRFPSWIIRLYKFEEGLCEEVECGSDPSSIFSCADQEIAKVYLVGLTEERRKALDAMLAQHQLKLSPCS